jgi:type 1 glutamine amidotransferase
MSIATLVLIGQDEPGYHDLAGLSVTLAGFLARELPVEVAGTQDTAMLEAPAIARHDLVILNTFQGAATAKQVEDLVAFVEGGKGVLALHAATIFSKDNPRYTGLLGGTFTEHAPFGDFAVRIVDRDHPIAARLDDFVIKDELYATDYGSDVEWLASATWDGTEYPLVWTRAIGKGRVCYVALGHGPDAYAHESFRRLVIDAAAWAAGRL